jgi:hypothetical protein
MRAVVDQIVIEDVWRGLYGASWKGLICDEAFAHPAKFSRALIRKIYDHVIAEGWAIKGDSVVDPFGGVALGGFDAMRHGLHWYGCELEAKFVGLGSQNIALWNERFSRMPNWGTARLIQGDSRKLVDVLSAANCCVSSPPYAGGCAHTGGDDPKPETLQGGDYHGIGLAVTSPPYASDTVNDRNGIDLAKIKKPGGHNSQSRKMSNYGEASGQLGAMREGDLNLAISSPPYATGDSAGPESPTTRNDKSAKAMFKSQGWREGGQVSDGNLATLNNSGFDVAVSSPPYEGSVSNPLDDATRNIRKAEESGHTFESMGQPGGQMRYPFKYSGDAENLGNQKGETFWSASRLILEQLHQVTVPGGHAVFVVKAFVRDKKVVDFPGQWAQLCEAVGFRLLHHHRGSLVEHSGTQGGFQEDREIKVERKSFFRRLAEAKGSPRIDHESVLCFERT